MISLVIWQQSMKDEQLSAFLQVCWRREFQPQTSEETCRPTCKALVCVQGVWGWVDIVLCCLSAAACAWGELSPLCFRFVSCFPLDVNIATRTPDLKTQI